MKQEDLEARREPETPPQVEELKGEIVALDHRLSEALEEIAWLKRVPETPSTGWQPIETAPRDGTQILIWIEGIEPRPRIAYWADRGLEYGWFALQSQHLLGVPVTHWMPLPQSPALPSAETPETEPGSSLTAAIDARREER